MIASEKAVLTSGTYFFDDLSVGDSFRTGRIVVTETHIVNFAGLTGDFFDVHMDDDFARAQGFPGRIAHGLMGLCMVDGLKNRTEIRLQAVASLGWKEWKFSAPIVAGDSIGAIITVVSMRPTSKGDRGIIELDFDVTNQHGVSVQSGRNALMMRRRAQP